MSDKVSKDRSITPSSTVNLLRRATASPSSTPTSNDGSSNSFIGNTPSTVLFFIALAVGVCIALLFIYFTLRYFIKTKFGVYVPSNNLASRAALVASPLGRVGPGGRYAFAGGYATMNHLNDFAEYPLQRDYNALLAMRENRMHGRRYKKKRKLTKDEVDELFPIKTYHEWENGGKEVDQERLKGLILHENELENVNLEQEEQQQQESEMLAEGSSSHKVEKNTAKVAVTTTDETDITDLENSSSKVKNDVIETQIEQVPTTAETDITNLDVPAHDEMHFSSGMCAICLDTLDDDDQVRGLICGHVFHQECIDPWLINRKACCPMCKRDYYMKDKNGNGDAEGDAGDAESLMPLDSLADFILPRPVSYRAQELLDALDAHEAGNNNAAGNANNDAANNNNNNNNNISVQDLVGIRELALLRLPSYYNVFKKIFWRIMGVTRDNLYDYLIVKIYEDRRRERLERESAERQRNAAGEAPAEEIELTDNAATAPANPPPSAVNTSVPQPNNAVSSSSPNSADDSARRDAVERMV